MKKLLTLGAVMLMTMGMSMTALAAYKLPTLIPAEGIKEVCSEGESTDTFKVKLEDVDYGGFIAYAEPVDSRVCKAEVEDVDDKYIKVRIRSKGTGTTAVKVWIDGYERRACFVTVKSTAKMSDTVEGVEFKHYGTMTGINGEAAYIDKIKYSEGKYWIYFDQVDMGSNTTDVVKYSLGCYNASDDPIEAVPLECAGVSERGTGYKISFRLPEGTKKVKIVCNDV